MAKITISPRPPVAGKSVTICYVGGPYPVTLELDWYDESLTPTSITCTAENPCVTFTVPAGATSLLVHDPSGNAEDVGTVIQS
jgi:hypothetical protein